MNGAYARILETGINVVDYFTSIIGKFFSITADKVETLEKSTYIQNRPSEGLYWLRNFKQTALIGMNRTQNKLFSLLWEAV